jgi:hypothetical protein
MNEAELTQWEILLGGIATLSIFSFLIRENPLYRLFEHLFMGVATAIGTAATFRYFIIPEVIYPLMGLDIVIYPDQTPASTYNRANLLLLLPMFFGALYYFILVPRFSWIAQLVIGFSLGVAGGNAFKATINEMLPQVTDSFRPLYIPGNLGDSASNVLFLITLLCSMSYFFFTFKRSEQGAISRSANLGRFLMMSCFGAFFGATIMARMALLVERLNFLITDFWPGINSLWA